MEELAVKKDFTDIYTQDSPHAYLKEMQRLQYRIADLTKPLYLSIAEQLYGKLHRSLNVLDIGSSYGINSALMRNNLTMSQLGGFFLQENEPTNEQARQFFKDHITNDTLNFYQIDISKQALHFSEDVGLCKKGIEVNLETCDAGSLEEKELPDLDMVIATGCIGYIGYRAFSNLFEMIKQKSRKNDSAQSETQNCIFAFSVLRIFDMEKIQKTFDEYGYSLAKIDLKPIRQRQFSDADEKFQTLSLLQNKGIDTKWYEDDGYFYADFYVASPKIMENQLISMSESLKKHALNS